MRFNAFEKVRKIFHIHPGMSNFSSNIFTLEAFELELDPLYTYQAQS